MTHVIRPVLGDLLMNGAVLFAWIFVLVLVGDAWWQKKQARALREPPSNRVVKRRHPFIKKSPGVFLALIIIPIVAVLVLRGRPNESAGNGGLFEYATNFHGDATCPVPVKQAPAITTGVSNLFGEQISMPAIQTHGDTSAGSGQLAFGQRSDVFSSSSGHKPAADGGIQNGKGTVATGSELAERSLRN